MMHDAIARRPVATLGSRVGHSLWRAVLSLQYGQMVAVLNRLPDQHLQAAGLRRADIAKHVSELVYGSGCNDAAGTAPHENRGCRRETRR